MNSTVLQVLHELTRCHLLLNGRSATTETPIDVPIADISQRLGISEEDVEEALDSLVDEQAVTRHSLGQFTVTRAGLQRSQLSKPPFPR